MASTSKRAAVTQAVLTAVSVAGVAILGALVGRQPQPQPGVPVPRARAAEILTMAGLTPDSLASAGVTGEQTVVVLQGVRDSWAALAPEFDAAQASYSTAYATVDRCERLVRAGAATQDTLAELGAARTALEAATARVASSLIAIIDATELDKDVQNQIHLMRDRRGVDLPMPYRVVRRSDAEWMTLRHAVQAEEICTRLREEVPSDVREVILALASDPAVVEAAACLAANGPHVQEAWSEAVRRW